MVFELWMHIERERETERRIKGGVFINGKERREKRTRLAGGGY